MTGPITFPSPAHTKVNKLTCVRTLTYGLVPRLGPGQLSVCICFPEIGLLAHTPLKNRGASVCVRMCVNACDFMRAWLPTPGHLL